MPGPGPGRSEPTRAAASRGAKAAQRTARLRAYAWHHGHSLRESLAKFKRAPVATSMTAAVIAIALALPAGLYALLDNVAQATRGWDRSAQISLFLTEGVDDAGAGRLATAIAQRGEVADTQAISRSEALAEFRRLSGFGEALDALERNPLPAVVVVSPAPGHRTPSAVQGLADELDQLAEVDIAQVDMQWVRRLYTLMAIGQRAVLVAAALLGLAALLVVGNTIRLEIQNRREEIEVTKLIGGTDAFIRRPFLYSGLAYGLVGGFGAWLLVELALGLLRGPVSRLSGLYGSGFELAHLPASQVVVLVGLGAGLGLAGSWVAVGRHLADIEPS